MAALPDHSVTFDRLFGGAEVNSKGYFPPPSDDKSYRRSGSPRNSSPFDRSRTHGQDAGAGSEPKLEGFSKLLGARKQRVYPGTNNSNGIADVLSPRIAQSVGQASRALDSDVPPDAVASTARATSPRAGVRSPSPPRCKRASSPPRLSPRSITPHAPGQLFDIDNHAGTVRCFPDSQQYQSSQTLRRHSPSSAGIRGEDRPGFVGKSAATDGTLRLSTRAHVTGASAAAAQGHASSVAAPGSPRSGDTRDGSRRVSLKGGQQNDQSSIIVGGAVGNAGARSAPDAARAQSPVCDDSTQQRMRRSSRNLLAWDIVASTRGTSRSSRSGSPPERTIGSGDRAPSPKAGAYDYAPQPRLQFDDGEKFRRRQIARGVAVGAGGSPRPGSPRARSPRASSPPRWIG